MMQQSRNLVRTLLLFATLACQAGAALAQTPGAADPAWTVTPSPLEEWGAIELQADGKLLVGGGRSGRYGVRRFDATGAPDSSFGSAGVASVSMGFTAYFNDMARDASGRIYVAGYYHSAHTDTYSSAQIMGLAVVRFLPDGTPDSTFGTQDAFTGTWSARIETSVIRQFASTYPDPPATQLFSSVPNAVTAIALQPNGKLLLLTHGWEHGASEPSLALVRFDADGTLDPGFANAGLALLRFDGVGEPLAMDVMNDGSIVVLSGDRRAEPRSAAINVIKLTARGLVDSSFGDRGKVLVEPDDFSADYRPYAIAVQDDGKVLIGAMLSRPIVETQPLLFRLDADGALDSGFGNGGYADLAQYSGAAQRLALEPNGKIVVGGTSARLLRLLPNGQRDPGFVVTAADIPGNVQDLAIADAAYVLNYMAYNNADVRKFITRTATTAPFASIAGGDRTLPDTDSVAGELVAVTGSASDTDGTILKTTWSVNGVEVASGTGAALMLRDGSNVISFSAIDSDNAATTVAVTYEITAPTTPLPRTRSVSSTSASNDSEFSLAIRTADGALVDTASPAQTLGITGYLFPQDADVNTWADIFVVAATPFGWYMRNADGGFEPWNTELADLVPAYRNQRLTAQVTIPVHAGTLALPGIYELYVGYRQTDGTAGLVYMAEATTLEVK